MSIRNLNIGLRTASGFALLVVLLLCLGGFALLQMSQMRQQSDEVETNWLPGVMALNEISQDSLRVRMLTWRLLVNRDAQAMPLDEAKLNELKSGLGSAQSRFEAMISQPRQRELFDHFKTAQTNYLSQQSQVMDLSRQNQLDQAAKVANGSMIQYAEEMGKLLSDLAAVNKNDANTAADMSKAVFGSARSWVSGIMLLSVLATVGLALLLIRSIVQPLAQALRVAEIVASGDLTQSITSQGRDEPARLLTALKVMQQSLRETIQRISDSSNQLASASEELSVVTEGSTRGLHQQNLEIEQAATAVNQMTTAVEEVARNAVATSEASRESDRIAQHGREQVRKTVSSIELLAVDVTSNADQVGQLAQKVYGISKVLDVIRSIADQTNLLALNAAIEAARAGDAGRGFAVVADEVRALAHRTQQSTQEIEQMIGGIQQGTDQAVSSMQHSNSRAVLTLELAQAAGVALEDIATAITMINERNLVIASASEEQAQVAREVDRNLTNIRDLASQTSAGASQTSAASQDLSRLAVDMNGMVARFSI